jgi:hypothetical protein
MFQSYIIKLIDNLPKIITSSKEPLILDLVLDGGAFNGSYHIGALLFLKEMEKRNYVKIQRISGSSVGSIVALLYFIDALETMPELYITAKEHFTKNYNFEFVKKFYDLIKNKLTNDVLTLINNRIFISYNNVKIGKKKVKSVYKNTNDIFTTIVKSCYIPYLIDGNIAYKNKYIDGCTPYIFKKELNTKILYLDLFGYDKIWDVLNITNEKTNFHRILAGLLDIHTFFIKQTNTSMCSYINDWTLLNKGWFFSKYMLEKICVFIIQFILYIKRLFPNECKNSVLCNLSAKIIKDIIDTIVKFYLI